MLPDPNTPKSESLPVASGNGNSGVNNGVKLPPLNCEKNKYKSVFFMDKELITFLKKNRAYSKFMRNLKYGNVPELHDVVVLAEEKGIKVSPFVAAFVWADTPEGYRFWSQLHTKYEIESTN